MLMLHITPGRQYVLDLARVSNECFSESRTDKHGRPIWWSVRFNVVLFDLLNAASRLAPWGFCDNRVSQQ